MFGKLKNLLGKKPRVINAIVLLEATPHFLDQKFIETICRNLGLQAEIRDIGVSNFSLLVDGFTIEVFSYDNPYPPFENETFASKRMDAAAREHQGFTVVECKGCPPGAVPIDSCRLQALLASQIVDDQTLAFYDHNFFSYAILSESVIDLLREGDLEGALAASSFAVGVERNDEMEHAIETARLNWPIFCDAFNKHIEGSKFSVKAAFSHDDIVEHMWVNPTEVSLDGFEGILLNTPIGFARPREGDVVRCSVEEVSDWGFRMSAEEEAIGLFTSELVKGSRH